MENRYCVIMGGGVGSRFWPFSRNNRPKQFLDFFGIGRSLLQMSFDRFAKIIPKDHIFIVTNEIYVDLIKEQLPDLPAENILLEPARRNTAPCIAWASYHIRAINPKANIVVAPSDHLILKEDEFARCVNQGLEFVAKYPALLTLGIKPNRPETGYGYIQIGEDAEGDIKTVKTFTEKPNLEFAKMFVESGEFFWNSGIFIWNVQTIINAFQRFLPDISNRFEEHNEVFNTPAEKQFIDENFAACPNISIDFGVMEKASNVFVLCADFGWSDLGSWSALYNHSPKNKDGNVAQGCKTLLYNTTNNVIAVKGDKLVVVEGLKDYIIAEADNVLLICPKSEEQKIKQFVTDAKMAFDDTYI